MTYVCASILIIIIFRSKLMLITTGTDGKKNVDRYLKVFSLVEVLDKHLHDLIQAGCSLFAKFVATVYCDQMRKVSVIVSFGDEGTTLIHGDHELERNLGQIATFLKVTVTFELITHSSELVGFILDEINRRSASNLLQNMPYFISTKPKVVYFIFFFYFFFSPIHALVYVVLS